MSMFLINIFIADTILSVENGKGSINIVIAHGINKSNHPKTKHCIFGTMHNILHNRTDDN